MPIIDIFDRRLHHRPRKWREWDVHGLPLIHAEMKEVVDALVDPVKKIGAHALIEIENRSAFSKTVAYEAGVGVITVPIKDIKGNRTFDHPIEEIQVKRAEWRLTDDEPLIVVGITDGVTTGNGMFILSEELKPFGVKFSLIACLIEEADNNNKKKGPWGARKRFKEYGIPMLSFVRDRKRDKKGGRRSQKPEFSAGFMTRKMAEAIGFVSAEVIGRRAKAQPLRNRLPTVTIRRTGARP